MYYLRPFRPSDWDAVRRLHLGEFEIPRRMEEAVVAVDEETHEVIGVQGCRVTRECYVWIDHSWATPKGRWRVFRDMHDTLVADLARKGIVDIFVWIKAAKSGKASGFARRMMRELGWREAPWKGFSLDIFKRK